MPQAGFVGGEKALMKIVDRVRCGLEVEVERAWTSDPPVPLPQNFRSNLPLILTGMINDPFRLKQVPRLEHTTVKEAVGTAGRPA